MVMIIMPVIGRLSHLSKKIPRLSCSFNCLALESVAQVYYSVKFFPFFFFFMRKKKRYKNKHFHKSG